MPALIQALDFASWDKQASYRLPSWRAGMDGFDDDTLDRRRLPCTVLSFRVSEFDRLANIHPKNDNDNRFHLIASDHKGHKVMPRDHLQRPAHLS